MAKQGTFAAYKELRPLQGDVSSDLQNQQQLSNQNRKLESDDEKLQYDRKEAQDKKSQDLADYVQKRIPQNIDTKVKSYNEVAAVVIQKAAVRIGEIGSVLSENQSTKKLSFEEVAKLTSEMDNLSKTPENLKSAGSGITDKVTSYHKGVQDGSLRKNLEFEKYMDIGTTGVYPDIGPDGKPLMSYDINQDGKIDVLDFDSITSGLQKFQFKKNYDFEKVVSSLGDNMESEKNKKIEGSLEVTTTGLNKDELNNRIKSTLYNPDGTPSDIMESFAEKKNVPLNNPDGTPNKAQYDIIEGEIKNALILNSKKGREESVNTEVRQQQEFEYKKRKDALDEAYKREKDALDTNTTTITESKGEFTGKPVTTTTRKVVSKNPRGKNNDQAKPTAQDLINKYKNKK